MYRLVIIDADESVLNCITQAVDWDELGFHIAATFSDGEAAAEYLKCAPADSALIAAELPGTAGMEVAAFICHNMPDCRVVMMSSRKDYDLMKRAMQCGVCDHLIKPVDPEEIRRTFEMIRRKLDQSDQEQALDKAKGQKKEFNSASVLVQQMKDYIERHILESISLESVSKQMHISTSHLIRIFKRETGHTYLEYVTKKKMEKAAEYFEKENLKVYEVSELLGYRSKRHFSTLFFKQFGCYPSEYFDSLGKD